MKSGYKFAVVTAVVLLVIIFAYYLRIDKPAKSQGGVAVQETPKATEGDNATAGSAATSDGAATPPASTDELAARMRSQSVPPTGGTPAHDPLALTDSSAGHAGTEATDAFPPATQPGDSAAGVNRDIDARVADAHTPARTADRPPAVDLFGPTADDTAAERGSTGNAGAAVASTSGTYTIKSGDTFNSIAAAKLGSSKKWRAIAKANPLVDPTTLKVGQVIKMPDGASASGGATASAGETPRRVAARASSGDNATTTVKPEGVAHKVMFGDTLSTLAYQYYGDRTQWRKIYDANKAVIGAHPDRLPDGVKLVIPARSSH